MHHSLFVFFIILYTTGQMFELVKGLLQPEMKMLSLITYPRVVSISLKLRSSSEHNLRYFRWKPGGCPIDCQVMNTVKAQKSMKDIVKILHLPSVVQPQFSENIFVE